jgi:hypothetical protein
LRERGGEAKPSLGYSLALAAIGFCTIVKITMVSDEDI